MWQGKKGAAEIFRFPFGMPKSVSMLEGGQHVDLVNAEGQEGGRDGGLERVAIKKGDWCNSTKKRKKRRPSKREEKRAIEKDQRNCQGAGHNRKPITNSQKKGD